MPFPLDREHRLYSRARLGLWHGVRALGLVEGDAVLAPAYHQGAEIEAFVRAGLECRFYETDELLRPQSEALDRLLTEDVKALHVIHYWGFPQDTREWRSWCDERGLFLIEDGAQALLSSDQGLPVGARGDLAVFCLYKSFGLPDGAAVACSAPIPEPQRKPNLGAAGLARRIGSALAQRSSIAATLHGRVRAIDSANRPFGAFLPGEFELGEVSDPTAASTRWLIPRVIDAGAADRRREHFAMLQERLELHVPEAFRVLPDGAVPIAFPVETPTPRSLASKLAGQGIDTGFLWPTWHPTLPVERFAVARHYRERVLALPVHQELTRSDVLRIAESAGRWLESTRHG
jgi:dTDP-4-amino-4,6-dideoxygalactose transaminase